MSNRELNELFSAGGPGKGWPSWQSSPDTSDWTPVLRHSLVYICAFVSEPSLSPGEARASEPSPWQGEGRVRVDRLVGFANVAWDGRDHAFLLDPRVHPDYRHRGIGSELVRRAADMARDAGCEHLHVDFQPELWPFYAACGFRPTDAGVLRLKP